MLCGARITFKTSQLMDEDLLLATLRKYKSEIEGFGVAKIGLFGSYLTGIENRESDIDIYISFHEGHATMIILSTSAISSKIFFPGTKLKLLPKAGLVPTLSLPLLKPPNMPKSPLPYLNHIRDECQYLKSIRT